MLALLVREGLARVGHVRRVASGWGAVERRLRALDLDTCARATGVPLETTFRLARKFAASPSSVVYSRVGVGNGHLGTLATYATDLLNVVAGRLGEVGGIMFPTPALDAVRVLRLTGGDGHGRFRSRARGLPETVGEMPSAGLANEIETPRDGQVRALLTFAGNPVLPIPNGRRLDRALASLDFMASIDLYVNETTRPPLAQALDAMPPADPPTCLDRSVAPHELVEVCARGWSDGAWAALASLFREDATWHAPGLEAALGREAVTGYRTRFARLLGGAVPQVRAWAGDDTLLLVEWRAAVPTPSGATYALGMAERFDLVAGRVLAARTYLDAASLARALSGGA